MTNRTLNREKAVRQPPTWRLSTSGGVLPIEEWDFQLPGGTTGMSPWLREVGAPCHCSSSGLCGALLGYGMVLSPLGSDKILDCPLDLLWRQPSGEAGASCWGLLRVEIRALLSAVLAPGRLGRPVLVFWEWKSGLFSQPCWPGQGQAQCLPCCMAGLGWLLPKSFLSC